VKKTAVIVVGAIAAIVIAAMLRPDDRVQIAKTISKGQHAIERKAVDDVMSTVAQSYHDQYGLTKASLRGMFEEFFKGIDSVSARYTVKEIRIEKKTAIAILDVWITAGAGGQFRAIAGTAEVPEALSLSLERSWFTWRVTSSTWAHPPSFDDVPGFVFPLHTPSAPP
jgi:hypothetical protein